MMMVNKPCPGRTSIIKPPKISEYPTRFFRIKIKYQINGFSDFIFETLLVTK
jgi:hypothetical protein